MVNPSFHVRSPSSNASNNVGATEVAFPGLLAGTYEWQLLDGVGHFPHNEVPETVSGELIRWAKVTA